MEKPTKAELRAILKKKRTAIPQDKKKALDRAIAEHIAASALFRNASMLLLYAPMEGEINLLPLARLARERGIPIAFPRSHKEDFTLTFHILTADARLSQGAYGIAEPPADAPVCVPDERALCLLPGLSFDKNGERLGYGKGYYDRFLATFPGETVGAVYSALMLREVPTDKYDIAARHVLTERGFLPAPPTVEKSAPAPDERNPEPPAEAVTAPPAPPLSKREKARLWWTHAWQSERAEGIRTPHLPLGLVLVTYLLLLLSRLIDARLLSRGGEYVGVILLQVLIFVLPGVLYCKWRGEDLTSRLRLRPPRPNHIFLLLCVLVMMITGGLLCSILSGGIKSLGTGFTLYDTFTAHTGTLWSALYALLAYAALPALGEELIYRAILCAETESNGAGVSIVVSATLFAMLHFSFPHFLTYFLLGLLLATCLYATQSFWAPFLLHLLYNVFCLFGRPFLSAFYVNAGSHEIYLFCLITLFLLFSALAAGEARKIYHLYAVRNRNSAAPQPRPIKQYPRALLRSVLSPVTAACVVIWLISAIINLF